MITIMALMASFAQAQDTNEDGCEDSYWAANMACVDPTAQLGPGATVGAGATIAQNATIGADVDIGAGAFIASLVTFAGRSSAVGARPVGSGTVVQRNTFIGIDHALGDDNIIGRSSTIGQRFETGNTATVGYAAIIGNDVSMGNVSTVGNLANIGDNTQVEANAVISRGVVVAASTSPSSPAIIAGIIGPGVSIGANATIDSTVRIRKEAILADNVTIQANARVGRRATLEEGTVVGANVTLGPGSRVTATSVVPDGTVVGRNEVYDNPTGIAGQTEVVSLPGGVSMTFRGIPSGTFEMGCKPGRDDDASGVSTGIADCTAVSYPDGAGPHDVTITRDFWCGETEVTQDQFAAAPGAPNPSYYSTTGAGSYVENTPNPPVDSVSWHDAAWFANWMTTEYNSTHGTSLSQCYSCSGSYASGNGGTPGCASVADPTACSGFRLPTEAEWEYAARGGESDPFSGSSVVGNVAWYRGNRGALGTATSASKATASKAPNAYGMYDMSGNLMEWANDWSNDAAYSSAPVVDPAGPSSGVNRVLRSGDYSRFESQVRSAMRLRASPHLRYPNGGFRVCRSVQ